MPLSQRSDSEPARKASFLSRGFQWRYAALVAGSMTVLLVFTGLHGLFVMKRALPQDVSQQILPMVVASTFHLFMVGAIYVAVVTVAAMFLTHRKARLDEEAGQAGGTWTE